MSAGLILADGPNQLTDLKINGRIYWGAIQYEKEISIGRAGFFVDGVCMHKFQPHDMWQVNHERKLHTGFISSQ
jgi:hypothetical protein